MSKEAMKLAKAWFERNTYGDEAVDVYEALCAALAEQPAQQEPVAWLVDNGGDSILIRHSQNFPGVFVGSEFNKRHLVFGDTSPPAQRTWVGLTDYDKSEIKKQANYNWETTTGEYASKVQALTEAKLKEKNT